MDNFHEGFYSLQSAFYMKHLTSEMLKAVRWLGYTQSLKCISLPVWKGQRASWIQSYWCFTMGKVGEGNGNLLQHSCLKTPMDRGSRLATVHGVAKSRMWLSDWTHTLWVRRQPTAPVTLDMSSIHQDLSTQHNTQHTVGWRKGLLSEWLHISSTGVYEIIVNYGLSPCSVHSSLHAIADYACLEAPPVSVNVAISFAWILLS